MRDCTLYLKNILKALELIERFVAITKRQHHHNDTPHNKRRAQDVIQQQLTAKLLRQLLFRLRANKKLVVPCLNTQLTIRPLLHIAKHIQIPVRLCRVHRHPIQVRTERNFRDRTERHLHKA